MIVVPDQLFKKLGIQSIKVTQVDGGYKVLRTEVNNLSTEPTKIEIVQELIGATGAYQRRVLNTTLPPTELKPYIQPHYFA